MSSSKIRGETMISLLMMTDLATEIMAAKFGKEMMMRRMAVKRRKNASSMYAFVFSLTYNIDQ
jgi:hypothetical protein